MILLALLLPILTRAAGGGLFAPWLRDKLGSFGSRVPEIIIVLIIGHAAFGLHWLALLAAAFSYLTYELGHGTFYTMNGRNPDEPDRVQTLEKLFGWAYRGDKCKPAYSWFMMGIKGILIALPLGPVALLNGILWPAAYWLGWKAEKPGNHEVAEYMSGLALFVVISL